ncbi:hypothetical protein C6A45_20640 [Enterobacter hormaechei]|nr:hypothetical protein C6A45_20640 [Enterobacter hormaechei]
MWLMKTLLTSGCTNQRGAGQGLAGNHCRVWRCIWSKTGSTCKHWVLRRFYGGSSIFINRCSG